MGPTVNVRLSYDAIDSGVAQLIDQYNNAVNDLETLRAALNSADGGAIVVTPFVASQLAAIGALDVTIAASNDPDDPPPPPITNPATTIAANAGDGQSGTVAAALSTPLSVLVTSAGAVAKSGEVVTWAVSGDALITPQSVSNAAGIAEATLTLGTVATTYTVTATRVGLSGSPVSFTALTATADSAFSLQSASLTDQSGLTSSAVGDPPSVLVSDQYGNAKAGTVCDITVTAGSGTADPAAHVTANASGLATMTSWTLGASAGLNTLEIASGSLSGSPVTFSANAVAAAPTQIAFTTGGALTGQTAGAAATISTVTVKDVSNNAVEGVTVTFAITTDFIGMAGDGSLAQASAVTDASGHASTTLTSDSVAVGATGALIVGHNSFTGSFQDAAGDTVTATATVDTIAGTATKLVLTTQPSSNVQNGIAFVQQPLVSVTDANGNRVLTNTATIAAAKGTGNGTLSGTTSKACVAGLATYTNLSFADADGGTDTIVFSTAGLTSVTSDVITVSPPIPAQLGIGNQPASSVTVGSQLSPAPTVNILDSTGGFCPLATNAVTVSLGDNGEGATLSGTLTKNAVAGVATFNNLSVDIAGSYTLVYTASNLTGVTSNAFTVAASSTANPNEPSGYVRFAEWDCTALPPTTRANFSLDGAWACERTSNQSVSGGKYYLKFPSGIVGTDPGNLRCSNTASATGEKRRNYLHWTGFQPGLASGETYLGTTGDGKYQNHSVDTKMCHFKCNGSGGGTGAVIMRLRGTGSNNALMSSFTIDILSKQNNNVYGQNLDSTKRCLAGQSNDIEAILVMDSGVGQNDGEWHLWVNGVKVSQHTNCQFHVTGSTHNIYDHWMDNTYGGTGGARTRVDYWIWDNFYFSDSD